MVLDHRHHYLDNVRGYLFILISPLQVAVDFPVRYANNLSEAMRSQAYLLQKNKQLEKQKLQLEVEIQRYQSLISENANLYRLLGISKRTEQKTLVAEVVSIEMSPFARKMLINKGSYHGVYDGLPVLDAKGVVGKVIHTTDFLSSVQLLSNPNHVLPIVVQRTGLRAIAEGTGMSDHLTLLYLPSSSLDIKVGDQLLTSGLGNLFPRGYPVAIVDKVGDNTELPYAEVLANPLSPLDRNKEVLLLWPSEKIINQDQVVEQHQQSEPSIPVIKQTPETLNVN